jgi:hypothetical protein
MPVPEDLAPVDAGIGRLVASFVQAAMELAAIGGLKWQFSADPADLDGGDMAALIWEARRLTAEQVRRVGEQIPPLSL